VLLFRVNTYAELYGNIKKGPIKNGPGNKLIVSKALADRSISGVVDYKKEGDAMDKFLGNHMSSLANNELYDTANRVASAFENSAVGITMPSL